MPTDPFVAPTLADAPRQEQNLATGVHLPPARTWRADRPGEVRGRQPHGQLFGTPGPNVGYALALANRARGRLALVAHERAADALAVVAELSMRRAASFGRAPVMADVEASLLVLGYQGGCDPGFAEWRARAVDGAEEDYPRRRALCNALDTDALRLAPGAASPRVGAIRTALRSAAGSQPGSSRKA